MNGKPTTMTSEQLETLLRNTPVNRVEKAEVMYSAPPELHVRGAVINVVIKRSHDYSFLGELITRSDISAVAVQTEIFAFPHQKSL